MYTLRTINPRGEQFNELIGDKYSFISRNTSYDMFTKIFQDYYDIPHVSDGCKTSSEYTRNCHGFIIIKGDPSPILIDHSYYIMTDSGKTFSNLSY